MVPLVSVVIAVYNGEKYIEETLDSLIHQTLANWDCWVVDDGSTDSTLTIVKQFCVKDSRINVIESGGGNGPYICANMAMPFCRGEFIARIDADDIALPERLKIQCDIMSENPKVNLCGSYFYYLNEDGLLTRRDFETNLLFLKWQIIFRNRLVHSTMMIRKSWFMRLGMYPAKRLAQDWYVWIEGISQDCIYIIPHPLIKWRIHAQSITKNESEEQMKIGADVSVHAVEVLLKKHAKAEYLLPVISALRGKPAKDPSYTELSMQELIVLWNDFLRLYNPKRKELRLLRNEFIYFGFYLLTVNNKKLRNEIKLLLLLCKTEFNSMSLLWLVKYFKIKIFQS
jgi:glycosyltransferase involved in cell wall biosynthesis